MQERAAGILTTHIFRRQYYGITFDSLVQVQRSVLKQRLARLDGTKYCFESRRLLFRGCCGKAGMNSALVCFGLDVALFG